MDSPPNTAREFVNGRACVGIGLRAPHYAQLLEEKPSLDFLEVHSENFFHAGGAAMRVLERVREQYPLSLHGVGLSLASGDAMAQSHLDKLAALVARVEPVLVSEHLCWGGVDGLHLNDLLPFPYTHEALDLLVERVSHVQEKLGRRILIENLSAYVHFRDSVMSECEFLAALAQRSGCGLLLDLNNLYVNARNCGFDARIGLTTLLAAVPRDTVGEIHLAGHERTELCLIDTHGSRVSTEVWSLYETAIAYTGAAPTLIEWDMDIPALELLLDEASLARNIQMQSEVAHV